jgi:mannose-6-phosphate isomerase
MSKKPQLYPLKFNPILKSKIWGGDKLTSVFEKGPYKDGIGESWELSGVSENISEVQNGELRGTSLNELLQIYGADLLGKRVFKLYAEEFPLLFKFIDAREDLSVQLHPDDELAASRHNSFGKTEMWYILDSSPKARLIIGFNREMDQQLYQKNLSEGNLPNTLNTVEIKSGDAYFIAPGTVHAIGGGTLLAEIQQTSDVTYRIYDWDRPNVDGNMRELHTELALEAIHYNAPDARLDYDDEENSIVKLCTSAYFETNKLKLTKPLHRDTSGLDSFRVYMCVAGDVLIESKNNSVPLSAGETILIPACIDKIILKTASATLLEVYIP